MTTSTLVLGWQVQVDNSGMGHNWKNIDADQIPASTIQEIEEEIIDNDNEHRDDFVASNGLHYRW